MAAPKHCTWLTGGFVAFALLLSGGSAIAGERHLEANNSIKHGSSLLLQQADNLQFNHEFDAALALLAQLIERDHYPQQARLMQARILLAQGRLDAARESCLALMGKSSLTVSATCLLEVKARDAYANKDSESLAQAYMQLQQIALNSTQAQHAASLKEIFVWQRQLLDEQAALLERHSESNNWLSYSDYTAHPTVNQLRLVDNWLALGQHQVVFEKHATCPTIGSLPEDSLIVRLAAAEQRLASARSCWQQLAAERIAIREARADPLHTSDLAYYFIHVQPNETKAQRYAEQNYSVAREPADERLLLAAQELTEKSYEH